MYICIVKSIRAIFDGCYLEYYKKVESYKI